MLKVNERCECAIQLDVYQQVLSEVTMTRTDTIMTAFGNSKIRPEGEVKLEGSNVKKPR